MCWLRESGVPEGTLFFTPQKVSLPEKDKDPSEEADIYPHPVSLLF
jgi:hypothetical protein